MYIANVNAGPNRTEQMSRETIDTVLAVLRAGKARTLDLTGGAPEMNQHFRYIVAQARKLGVEVIGPLQPYYSTGARI